MSQKTVKRGSTDQSVIIRIIDSTAGTPETGVVYNTSGIDMWYRRDGQARVAITEASLPATNAAHTDGGIIHIDDGYYRLDLPDAAVASSAGVNGVMVAGSVPDMIVIGAYLELVSYDPNDSVRLGLTALPNAAADAAGGLPISDAGGLDLDQLNMNVTSVLTDTGTTIPGILDDLAQASALTDAASQLTTIDGIVDAILEDTGTTLDGRIPAALVGGRMDASVGAMANNTITAAAIATGAIDADAIADGAIDAGAIASNAITAAKIADGAIDAATFAAGAINAAAIANAAIDSGTFAAGAINAEAIADGAIDAATFAAGAINAAAIADGAIDAATFASGAITATVIAADAIGASELAADAVAEIADAIWDEARSAHTTVGSFGEVATAASVVDAIWDESLAGHTDAGSTGAALTAAGSAGDPWSTLIPGAYGAGTAGKILGDNINAPIATIDAVVDSISARIPSTLINGRIDASVGAMAANVVTASAIATGAIDADAIADNAIDAGAIAADAITAAKIANSAIDIATFAADTKTGNYLNVQVKGQDNIDFGALQKASLNAATPASVTGSVGSVTGSVGSVTGNVGGNVVGSVGSVTGSVGSVTGNVGGSVGSIAAGGITAASIADDAIGASELAADAIAEIADQVWDELLSGHAGVGSAGAALAAASSAGDPWSTPLPGSYEEGTAGKMLSDINTDTAAILVDTGTTLPGELAQASALADVASQLTTIDGIVDNILEDTGTTVPAQIAALNNISAAEVGTAVSNQLDAAISEPANLSSTKNIRNFLYWLYSRFFHKNTQTATQQITYKANATTPLATRTVSDDGTTQTLGAAS